MLFTIDHKQKKILDSLDGMVGCKDLNSVFLYGNKETTENVGLKNSEDIIGRTQFDIPYEAAVNCADIWNAQDKIVIQERKTLEILDIHPFINGWKAYITKKKPLLNDDKTEVVGTIYHGLDITTDPVINMFKILSKRIGQTDSEILSGQNSKILTENINKPELTIRQTEVLFLLIFGKTSKDIAQALEISHRTVEAHTEDLKNRFNAKNKPELIDKAYSLGIEKFIPKSLFFTKQLSVILD